MLKGIDISTHQKKIDYNKLKEQGIEFVILRCGFGKDLSQKDKMFDIHYEGCKKAGLKVGAYHYSYAKNAIAGIEEAKACLEFIKGKEFDLPIFYDLEDKIVRGIGKEIINQIALDFCKLIKSNGYEAGVYANLAWFRNLIDPYQLIENGFKIWLAQWIEKEEPDATFPINFWQYTSKGKLEGIEGYVDMNNCFDEVEEKPIVKKTNEEIAEEVIQGLWGNQPERQTRLEQAGYNYQEVQKIVNNRLNVSQKTYIVKSGDNLTKIAKLYGTTISKIVKDNDIKDPDKIYVGQRLIIK